MCRVLIVSRFVLPAPLKFERRLELRLEYRSRSAPARRFLPLISAASSARRARSRRVRRRLLARRDLVDFVDVNDAELRQRNVAVRFLHQLAHEIFDVAADVTGLAKFRRVRFDERHFDQLRDVFDQVGFSDAGRADEDDILLRVFGLLGARRRLRSRAGADN